MKEHTKWLWMARAMFVLSTVAVYVGSSDIRVCTAYIVTAIMYSTSAILKGEK